jgi:hypothetical protein
MSSILLLLLQASAPVAPIKGAEDFDLRKVHSKSAGESGCGTGAGDEIVICGARGDGERYRYKDLTGAGPEPLIPRAEVDLGHGATVDLHVEQVGLPDGTVSKRVMATLKMKF